MCFRFFSGPRGSITLSRCRCRKADKLSRAHLCVAQKPDIRVHHRGICSNPDRLGYQAHILIIFGTVYIVQCEELGEINIFCWRQPTACNIVTFCRIFAFLYNPLLDLICKNQSSARKIKIKIKIVAASRFISLFQRNTVVYMFSKKHYANKTKQNSYTRTSFCTRLASKSLNWV